MAIKRIWKKANGNYRNEYSMNFQADWVESHPKDYEIIPNPGIDDYAPDYRWLGDEFDDLIVDNHREFYDEVDAGTAMLKGEIDIDPEYFSNQDDIDKAQSLIEQYQSLRNTVNKPSKSKKTRMAASPDVVDKLIKEYERELDIESDAIRYASNRRPDLDLLKADGQSYASIEDQLLALGELRGNVPAPLVDKLADGNELRTHTRYGTNDVTGEREIRPFIDTETGEALATEFGRLDIDPHTKGGRDDTANEIVALNALKLMDEGDAEMYRVPGKHHYADGKRGDRKVEMMIADRGVNRYGDLGKTNAIPAFTNLVPSYGHTADDVKQAFRSAQREVGGSSEKAVALLKQKGIVEDNGQYGVGKILRSDINEVGGDANAVYDELLISGYPEQLTKRNREFRSDTLAVAPETLHLVKDLGALRDDLKNNQVRGARSITTKNYGGGGGRGHERVKVLDIVPTSSRHVQDLSVSHPLTQQLLQNLPVI